MAREKHWASVDSLLFTTDGSDEGVISVLDTQGLYVKQWIILKSNTAERVDLEIKRVFSKTRIKVGRKGHKIDDFVDITEFLVSDSATIRASEQPRRNIPPEDIIQAKFAREPINADRVVPVDNLGDFITENNPSATKDRETAVLANLKTIELFNLPLDDYVLAGDEIVTLSDGTLVKVED